MPRYAVPEQTPFYAPPNIPLWVLDNVWSLISLSVVGGLLKLSREQHCAVVLLANAHPNVYLSSGCPILKLPPLCHTACLLLLIKNLTSCTSRDTNLSKTPG
jgi:hypothetical protein